MEPSGETSSLSEEAVPTVRIKRRTSIFEHEGFVLLWRIFIAILTTWAMNLAAVFLVSIPFHTTISHGHINIFTPLLSAVYFLTTPLALKEVVAILAVDTLIILSCAAQVTLPNTYYVMRSKTKSLFLKYAWFPILAFVFGMCGSVIAHSYLNLLGLKYSGFLVAAVCRDKDGNALGCLDEGHLVIMFLAFISGVHYFLRFRLYKLYVLDFPVAATSIWSHVQDNLLDYWEIAVSYMVIDLPIGYVGYYCISHPIRWLVTSFGRLSLEYGGASLVNIPLFLFSYFTCCFVILSFKVCWDILQMYLTRRMELEINVDTKTDNALLADAMASDGYLKYLAYYDLRQLSDGNSARFGEIFKLSCPSGAPANWNAIMQESMILIRNFNDCLAKFAHDEKSAVIAQKLKATTASELKPPRSLKSLFSPPYRIRIQEVIPEISEARKKAMVYSMRDLCQSQRDEERIELKIIREPIETSPLFNFGVKKKFDELRLVKFVKHKERENKMNVLMSNSDLVNWAVDSLVSIAVESLDQDIQGVVQRDLTQVLYLCLDYYETINKFRTLSGRNPDEMPEELWPPSIVAQEGLYNCIVAAIAKLHETFYSYLDVLNVNSTYRSKLEMMVIKEIIPEVDPNANDECEEDEMGYIWPDISIDEVGLSNVYESTDDEGELPS